MCSRHRATLIFDEIQTGLGRTGQLPVDCHEDAETDATLTGKALSGGFCPVSAVLSNSEVPGVLIPGEHGSTSGGNPPACAVTRTGALAPNIGDRVSGKDIWIFQLDCVIVTGGVCTLPHCRPVGCLANRQPGGTPPTFLNTALDYSSCSSRNRQFGSRSRRAKNFTAGIWLILRG
ncbi:aminotransferase class III-fold pyridoxal phosphate-dependent enzyme [Desulfosarcina alkanivorans]|uniref:aminotransferase class III-fold pyridoxal phosphate-dependent enzyme n=1 Tax=Desulfosarcina alkanivorans TaxID=571177 RepID=UPI0022B1F2A7|nr:aminotransferase class III-fold pyridoxal phosphate-dependent enzyme [Desulfosarcina alkanivorans]